MLNSQNPPHVTMAHPLPFFTASLSASSVPPRSASVANTAGPAISNGGAMGPNMTSSPSPDIQHVTSWDASKVAAWIVSAGFNGYDRRFLENDISGDVLVHLNDEFLQEMVIDKVGTRIAMLKAIYALKKMHGVPIEAGDFVPLVDPTDASKSMAPSERKRSLFSFFDSHHNAGEPADPRRVVETLRHQADQMQRMSNEISQLTSELQRLREDVNPLLGRNSTSSSTRMGAKKSPTLLTRSLTSAGLSNPLSSSTPALNTSGASASSTSAWSPPPMPGVAVPPATDDSAGTIKVYGDRLPSRQHDGYKSFKVHRDETCSMFLPSVLRKYKINDDWSQYALFIVPGAGNERCLGYDEYPFRVYTEYFVTAPASPEPYFVLRHIKQASAQLSRDGGRPTAAYATKESTDLKYRGRPGGTPPTSTSNLDQPIVPSLPPSLPPPIPPAPASGPIIGIPTSASSSSTTFRSAASDSAASLHRPAHSPSMPAIPSISAPPTSTDGPTITDDPLPPPTESSGAVAVYEYNAQRPDELSLIIGDRVVIRSRSTGWCVVDKDGETGWVPAGCLIEENKGENEIEGKRGRVLFDYEKIGPNELSIKKGEALTLVKGYQHWLLVESLVGVRGWVPSCYVTISKSRSGTAAAGAAVDKDGAKKPRSGSPVPDLVKGMAVGQYGVPHSTTSSLDQPQTPGSPVVGPPSHLPQVASSSASISSVNTAGLGSLRRRSHAPPNIDTQAAALAAQPAGLGSSSPDRRLETAVQDLQDLLIRSRGALGGPGPMEAGSDALLEGAQRNLGNSINLLQLLVQLPSTSSRYNTTVERLERLANRVRALDPVVLAEEVHGALAELVNAVRATSASSSSIKGAAPAGVGSPVTGTPPVMRTNRVGSVAGGIAMSAAAAAAGAPSNSVTPPPRMTSVTPPPGVALGSALQQGQQRDLVGVPPLPTKSDR